MLSNYVGNFVCIRLLEICLKTQTLTSCRRYVTTNMHVVIKPSDIIPPPPGCVHYMFQFIHLNQCCSFFFLRAVPAQTVQEVFMWFKLDHMTSCSNSNWQKFSAHDMQPVSQPGGLRAYNVSEWLRSRSRGKHLVVWECVECFISSSPPSHWAVYWKWAL